MKVVTYDARVQPDDFDVQRQSPYTPEGQVETAGRFARGFGPERMRRVIAVGAFAAAALAIAAIVVDAV